MPLTSALPEPCEAGIALGRDCATRSGDEPVGDLGGNGRTRHRFTAGIGGRTGARERLSWHCTD